MRHREVKPKVTQLISSGAERPAGSPGALCRLRHSSRMPAPTCIRVGFSKLADQGASLYRTAVTTVLPWMVCGYCWCFYFAPTVWPLLMVGEEDTLTFPHIRLNMHGACSLGRFQPLSSLEIYSRIYEFSRVTSLLNVKFCI